MIASKCKPNLSSLFEMFSDLPRPDYGDSEVVKMMVKNVIEKKNQCLQGALVDAPEGAPAPERTREAEGF